MRDLLERELLESYRQGDTTVLAEILENLDDDLIIGSLSDEGQALVDKVNEFLATWASKSNDSSPEIVERMLETQYQFRWNGDWYYVSKELSGLTADETSAYEYLFRGYLS